MLCAIQKGEQAGYQLAALAVTLLTSLLGGMLTGLIIKLPCFQYRGPIHEVTRSTVFEWNLLCAALVSSDDVVSIALVI